MTITQQTVELLYHEILNEVKAVVPLQNWVIQPTSWELISHKSKYGLAYKNGSIKISQFFLGTDAVEKLKNTLRHEFAHLCVGLNHHHDKLFRRVEKQFGVTEEGNAENECKKIIAKIPFKYTLYFYLVSGVRVNAGGAHRKTKTFAEYDRQKQPRSYKGVPIERFEYIEN